MQQFPIFKDYTSISYTYREIDNNTGMVRATLSGPNGAEQNVGYLFIYRDGVWKIVGLSLIRDEEEQQSAQ